MGKLIVTFILAIIIVNFFIISNRAFAHEGSRHIVKINEEGFIPTNLEIEMGDSITFENVGEKGHWPASNIHPTHGIYPEFDPKREVKPGGKWTFEFSRAGTFKMHDHLFPMFTGVVIVKSDEGVVGKVQVNQEESSFFERILSFFINIFHSDKELYKFNDDIREDDVTVSDNKDALYSYVKKYGPKRAIEQLVSIDHAVGRECHEDAHVLGKYSYEIYGEKVFGMCSAECHSGCYHGATEAFFKEHGTVNLQENLKIVCGSALNRFFSHQCLHGIGHGLMAWTDYEIHEALKECDLLDIGKESCYSGVFMENIVGALAVGEKSQEPSLDRHYTKYLNNDPQYPCTVVDVKYKNACYFYQTSRMTQLFNFDFAKVAKECSKIPIEYKQSCFESMGRDVGGFTYNVPAKAILLCMNAEFGKDRIDCLEGAVQNAFWDPTGQSTALNFCRLLKDMDEKETCYSVIIQRAGEVLVGSREKRKFCGDVERSYSLFCSEEIGS